ncbi:hypothetical protein IC744_07345 [Microbacterium hominis]|uniref:LpqB family beta-propeller domain-containing protein n=1 Tax=Microbacterium TaxID=33882 RepID=UPI00168BC106|nr:MULTISPECIES: LpqB family beta-propeller domain-containing protein [Microbacterium]QOC26152.1 hypothetical protein IC745_01660 [Microbacterium hominis]QOC30117.1 hypothetical protein IC744_07345 [Microbacterium hominis]QYF97542.1 hypothetical protein KY498_15600 [Microbacterium sp. PAMC21962]
MMRIRLRGVVAALLAALLSTALVACAGLPTSGPVNPGVRIVDDDGSADFAFIPKGPVQDATPQQIVEGFIAAGTGPSNNWETAQQFLAPSFKGTWKPQAGVTVYAAGQRTLQQTGTAEFVLTVAPVATVDATGELTPASDDGDIPLSFKLAQQADGQWRITQAPDGIVLDQTRFATVFDAYSLMYFDPTWTYLVPDVRWFPRYYAATNIAEGLVDGSPAPWLRGAVVSAFTDGARLELTSVPRQSNVAQVTLQDGARNLDQVALDRMQTQLEASLGTAGISGVDMILPGGQALMAQKVDVRSTAVASNPVVRTEAAFGFASGSTVTPIAGLSDAILNIATTDIEVNADRTTAAVRDVSGAVLAVHADAPTQRLDQRAGLIAPSIDPSGYIWTVPTDAPSAVRAYAPDGTIVTVAGGWSGASQILAQRVSRDGTRLVAAVRDGDRYAIWGAGIQRDRNGVPTSIESPEKVLDTLPGPATALTWLDGSTLGVLTSDGEDQYLETLTVGGFASASRTPGDTTTVAGQKDSARVRDADGEVYAQRGANWQQLVGDVRVLAIQQGAPR